MLYNQKKRLNCLLREITNLQVAALDGDLNVPAFHVRLMQQEALDLGFEIAMAQIFTDQWREK